MPDYREYYKARTALTNLISKDLLGPVTDNEILIEMPTQYYVMGKLYPVDDDAETGRCLAYS